jgi:hypothetical protein
MCSLQSLTCSQVQLLPRQWMVGPSSDSRLWLGETPAGASSAGNDSQRREGEADGPQGQRPARVSRGGPSWTEFVRPAHQAVVAFAGADMINRAEPRACGHSREPRFLDPEPGMERNVGSASNGSRERLRKGAERRGWLPTVLEMWPSEKCGAPHFTGENPPYGMIRGGGGNEVDGLMTFRHDARKGRYLGSHWPNHVRASALLDHYFWLYGPPRTNPSSAGTSCHILPRTFLSCSSHTIHASRSVCPGTPLAPTLSAKRPGRAASPRQP